MNKNYPKITYNKLYKLYSNGKSIAEIAKLLDCSGHKIAYWLDKYKIQRRSRSEAIYQKLNPHGDPFQIKINLSKKEAFLFGLGIGIYWGEGNKSLSSSSLRVANSDPGIIRAFIIFIRTICRLKKERFSFSIICFNDINPEDARKYWSQQLKISPERFGKITIIPKQGKGTYKRKSQYGVCTVQANNVKLRHWILEKIEKCKKRYSNAWVAQG